MISKRFPCILENDYISWYDMIEDPDSLFSDILQQVDEYCVRGEWKIQNFGVTREPKRSIIIEDHNSPIREADSWSKSDLNVKPHDSYDWSHFPVIYDLGEEIYNSLGIYEEITEDLSERLIYQTPFDYCLVNIYDDGKDGIGWHADREAGPTDIMSVSLGSSRRFGMRGIGMKNNGGRCPMKDVDGYRYGVNDSGTIMMMLESGHVVHMKKGCQQQYKHTICKTKESGVRINLTYRKYI